MSAALLGIFLDALTYDVACLLELLFWLRVQGANGSVVALSAARVQARVAVSTCRYLAVLRALSGKTRPIG